MNEQHVTQADAPNPASAAVRELLRRHPVEPAAAAAAVARRLTLLERQAPEIVRIAREDADAQIEYMGIAGLPDGPTFYETEDGVGWVLVPGSPEEAVAPRRQMETIRRVGEELNFPLTFVAHEVTPEISERVRGQAGSAGMKLRPAEVAEFVPPVPPPAEATAKGERMAQLSQQVVDGARRAGRIVVGTVAIPAAAAAAVVQSIATLDPLVLGAIPAGPDRPGAPAAWYLIEKWDW